MGNRILITGGLGFIGYHLIQRLTAMDPHASLLVYDKRVSYLDPLLPHEQWMMNKRYQVLENMVAVVQGDTCDRDLLTQTIRNFRPTHIVHLAGLPLANTAMIRRRLAMEVNVEGTLNVLYALEGLALPLFQQYSTSLPQTEMVSRQILTLPLYPAMSDADVAFVVDRVKEGVRNG